MTDLKKAKKTFELNTQLTPREEEMLEEVLGKHILEEYVKTLDAIGMANNSFSKAKVKLLKRALFCLRREQKLRKWLQKEIKEEKKYFGQYSMRKESFEEVLGLLEPKKKKKRCKK